MDHSKMTKGEAMQHRSNPPISHLIEAYLELESVANRDITPASAVKIESAMAIIQLLGTSEQIRLAQQFISDFVKTRSGSFDTLLEDLRQHIRTELGLESQPGISLIRIGVPQ